jgi:hypothetical protein
MKILKVILTMISFIVCFPAMLSAENDQPDPVPDDIEAILPPYISDIAGSQDKMTEEEDAVWKAKVDATPDVTNRLCKLFWAYWDSENDQQIARIGDALATRHDLSLAQQGHLAGLIKKLDAGKMTQDQLHHWNSLLFGLKILENYPSPEHEEIVLEILNSGNYDYKLFALATIQKIGTQKSIDYIRRLIEEEKNRIAEQVSYPKGNRWLYHLEGLEKQLVQREERKRRDKERNSSGTYDQKSKQHGVANQETSNNANHETWWVWVVGSFMVIPLVACYTLLRSRRLKS